MCVTYLSVFDAGPPRFTGSKMNAWLVDGNTAKRSSCSSSSDSGCIVDIVDNGKRILNFDFLTYWFFIYRFGLS